jgi:hypothetical protein
VAETEEQLVMKLVGGVEGMENHPELLAHVGRFVVDYQPERYQQGEQWLWTSGNPREALGFPDLKEIHTFIRQDIGIRLDGKLDLPITVYHISVAKRKEFED